MLASIAENFSNGGISLLKTLGAVAGAAVLLYLLLLLIKLVGNKLEKKTYDLYKKKCEKEGTVPISYEEFYAKRASGEKVLWKRGENAPTITISTETTTAQPAPPIKDNVDIEASRSGECEAPCDEKDSDDNN